LLSLVGQLLMVAGIVVLAASQRFGNSTLFDFDFPAVMSALANHREAAANSGRARESETPAPCP
jgi:hypothetical protein